MAVLTCRRTRNRSLSYATGYRNEYKVEFLIDCDSIMNEIAVYAAATTMATGDKLPIVYQYYDYDGVQDQSSYAINIDLVQTTESGLQWKATVNYGRTGDGNTPQDQTPNPLDQPIKYRIEWIEEQMEVTVDRNGARIVNTVGDAFDELIEEPQLYPVLVAEKNYLTIQEIIDIGMAYHRTVNDGVFYGGQPRTVKFMPIQSGDIQVSNNISYYTATLRFAFNPNTWDFIHPNNGHRFRKVAGGPIGLKMDDDTRWSLPFPMDLKADGTLLPVGDPPVMLTFEILPEADYSLIGV